MTTLSELIDETLKECGCCPEVEDYDLSALWVKTKLEAIKQALPQHEQEVINNALMAARIAGFEDYKKTELDLAQEKAKWQAEPREVYVITDGHGHYDDLVFGTEQEAEAHCIEYNKKVKFPTMGGSHGYQKAIINGENKK